MATNHDIINELRKSYAMELETVENYLANSIDLDGVRAEEIKKALLGDIEEELSHARKLGNRIKVLEGRVPGLLDLNHAQRYLQPPQDSTDLIAVIHGVIRAEEEAIDQYKKIIRMCDPIDLVTQDVILESLRRSNRTGGSLSGSFTSTNVAKESDSPPLRHRDK